MTADRQLAFLASCIFLGVLFPSLASLFKPLLFATIFLMFVFVIFQVQLDEAIAALTRDRSAWIVITWQLLVLPLCAAVLLKPLLDGQWYVFTVVTLCASAITATTALSKIFNLNDAMALSVCIVGAVLMPLPLYVILNFVAGLPTQIELSIYIERILIFIALPFVIVWVMRKLLHASHQQRLLTRTPTIVLVLLMIFGLSVMDGVRDMMSDNPHMLAGLIALAFSISLLTQVLTYVVLKFLGVRNAKTACLLSAYRNMGMVAAIAGPSMGENFLIFVGVWQLPMYILPLALQRFYQESPAVG